MTGSFSDPLAVVVAIAAALLVPAGWAKLRRPAVARVALGWPARPGDGALRLLGAAELSLAVVVLTVGGRLPHAALAVTYLAFAVVAARQRARGASCGCFGGATETPTSRTHVVLDAVAALAAAGAAVLAAPPVWAPAVELGVARGGAVLVLVVAATASAQALLTVLPELSAARDALAPS